MAQIILNEKRWAEDALSASRLGVKPFEALRRLVSYYRELGYSKNETRDRLEDFMIRCDPRANLVKLQPVIDDAIKYSWKRPLVIIDPVGVTQGEMNRIAELNGVVRQRLMFTLVCLARYGNAVNPENKGWVNREVREIFSLANVKASLKNQSLLFNDLWREDFIGFSNVVDNINVNVKILDDASEPVVQIDDFRNLGYQYMRYIGESYMPCQNCGLVVKRTSPRQKYCKDCAADINIQKTIENRRKSLA